MTRKKKGPMRYRNVSGHERILMVTPTRPAKVGPDEIVEVTDDQAIQGLVGQEKMWEPVAEPVANEEKE